MTELPTVPSAPIMSRVYLSLFTADQFIEAIRAMSGKRSARASTIANACVRHPGSPIASVD